MKRSESCTSLSEKMSLLPLLVASCLSALAEPTLCFFGETNLHVRGERGEERAGGGDFGELADGEDWGELKAEVSGWGVAIWPKYCVGWRRECG